MEKLINYNIKDFFYENSIMFRTENVVEDKRYEEETYFLKNYIPEYEEKYVINNDFLRKCDFAKDILDEMKTIICIELRKENLREKNRNYI